MNYFHIFIDLHNYMCRIDTFDHITQRINEGLIKARNVYAKPCLILLDVSEGRVYGDLEIAHLSYLIAHINNLSIQFYIVIDNQHLELQHRDMHNIPNLIWCNWFAIMNYMYNIGFNKQRTNKIWNDKSNKALFTPGKIDRYHRCTLLGDMWRNNLLEHLVWSCVPSTKEAQNAQNILKYNDSDFEKFINKVKCELDIKMTNPLIDYNHIGYPYDVSIFKNTNCSVIAESDFYVIIDEVGTWVPKFTEKTYRAIANMHPIIFSYYPGIVKKFEEHGYKSFKDYLKIPEYNEITNDKKRIKATIENIIHFPNSIASYRSQILFDVQYNFNLFLANYEKEIQKLSCFLDLPNYSFKMNPQEFIKHTWASKGNYVFQKVTW